MNILEVIGNKAREKQLENKKEKEPVSVVCMSVNASVNVYEC